MDTPSPGADHLPYSFFQYERYCSQVLRDFEDGMDLAIANAASEGPPVDEPTLNPWDKIDAPSLTLDIAEQPGEKPEPWYSPPSSTQYLEEMLQVAINVDSCDTQVIRSRLSPFLPHASNKDWQDLLDTLWDKYQAPID